MCERLSDRNSTTRNDRVLVLRHRGVCVRLIKRFMVYPTKEGLVPFLRDNCANRAANTWKNIP